MMKKLLIPVLTGLGLCFVQIGAYAQEVKEHISKQFTLQRPASGTVLSIYNIEGSIKVEGYSGTQVQIEIDQTITGKTQADLDLAKREFKLEFDQNADSVMAYVSAPYDSRPRRNRSGRQERRYYNVTLEYSVKVPFNTNLTVSTINKGIVSVSEVYGILNVNNVNGAIKIEHAKSKTRAHTVNGDVEVSYLAVPQDSSSYHTINGKIEVGYPSNLSADLRFKSMNGQFYTDFPDVEPMPSEVIKTQTSNSKGTMYRLNKNAVMRFGTGGKPFSFETLNGNIYIKKL